MLKLENTWGLILTWNYTSIIHLTQNGSGVLFFTFTLFNYQLHTDPHALLE